MVNKKVKRSLRRSKTPGGVKTRRSMYRKKNTKANRRGLAFASRKSRRASRRASRCRVHRHRGGDYIEGMSRPFFASVYPNTLQNTYASITGVQPNNYPGSPAPENMTAEHSWNYIKDGTIISPDLITKINTGFTLMASDSPYAPNPLTAPGAGVSAGTASATGSSGVLESGAGVAGSGLPGTGAGGMGQSSLVSNIERGGQSTQTF